jgi:RND family efflux transporter MFP subunit
MGRAIVVILILAALGSGSYWLYLNLVNQPQGETVMVRRGAITSTVSATGKVEPVREVSLSFKIGGRLSRLLVREGEQVEEGQLLAELDTRTLDLAVKEAEANLALSQLRLQEARSGSRQEEIDAARANLAAAQARLDDLKARPRPDEVAAAKAALDKAKVAVQDAQHDYDKVSWLPDIGTRPEARRLHLATIELKAAQARYERALQGPTPEELRAAEAEVEAARAQLRLKERGPRPEDIAILEKQVDLARINLELAQAHLADARLTSPIAGTVLTLPVREGEFVAPQQVVATVGSLEALRIKADIDEVDVGKVAVGQQVAITFDAFPGQTVEGRITEIFPEPILKQGATVYRANVEFSTDLPIRPRMAADLTITARRKEGVLLVPNRAIQTVGRKKVVEVLKGSQVVRRTVEVGLSDETSSEVVKGLKEGEEVLVR